MLVANSRKLRLIYANKQMQDRRDRCREPGARLARVDPKLLYPLKHRGEDSQTHLAIVRSRGALVSARTQLVNPVRGAVKSFGALLPKCPAVSFHNKAPEHIPRRSCRPSGSSSRRSARSHGASANTIASWRRSPKSITPKRSSPHRGILQRPPLSPSPSGSLAWIMCRMRRAEMLSPSTREASAGL